MLGNLTDIKEARVLYYSSYKTCYIYFPFNCIINPCVQNPPLYGIQGRRNVYKAIFFLQKVLQAVDLLSSPNCIFLSAIFLLTELWGHWWPAYRWYYSICSKTFDYPGHKRYANLFSVWEIGRRCHSSWKLPRSCHSSNYVYKVYTRVGNEYS